MSRASFTTGGIARALGLSISGDPTLEISRIAAVDKATAGSITFVTGRKLLSALEASQASAVIMPGAFTTNTSAVRLHSDDPYLSYAHLTQLWVKSGDGKGVVHSSAVIGEGVELAATASVGPQAVIEDNTVIGENVRVDAGAFVGSSCQIGDNSRLFANSTVLHGCTIGQRCEVHSGAVIGADGFGWAPSKAGWQKIHQLGAVVLGDRVSVGASTTIDRGALDDTIIGDGVILDNQIQIAHNVVIGSNTAIAGCTGIAGSTKIGRNCRIGGAVSIVGHLSICDNVLITADSFVNRSISSAGSYSSGYPLEPSAQWRKNVVRLHRLDDFVRQTRKPKSS
ncbi:UDP-3-O-(3-hydroxymyristoyl)glucosamine N-acyltransferase [Chromatiales bacterium (ex Bugula neritina AB1)]|nr:UDP-3-O-(3-hydroxymyristoyl)glucosamine N-acyltransferase [Chromatiales bacterium (ex Bugula neritina AB1)]